MDYRIRFRIQYNRRSLLVLAFAVILLVTVAVSYPVLSERVAAASEIVPSEVAAVALRQYYLAKTPALPPAARAICAANGYHFASLWEIVDVSNLHYNTSLGLTGAEGGQGPPSDVSGWVQTGGSAALIGAAGEANCNRWTSVTTLPTPGGGFGTIAGLPNDWTAGDQDIGVWQANVAPCNLTLPVWCVEGVLNRGLFLPSVSRQ